MARLRSYSAFDIRGEEGLDGEILLADPQLIISRLGDQDFLIMGSFDPEDPSAGGVVSGIEAYDRDLLFEIDRLELELDDPGLAGSPLSLIRAGLAGDDTIVGSGQKDVLNGFGGDDRMKGGAGNDVIFGGRGADRLDGGKGKDRIDGGRGKDRIDGGKGSDVIEGGRGNDRLDGGKGADRFVFGHRDGQDRVRDFDPDRDAIEITRGASRLKDLEFSKVRKGVEISYAKTEILLEDVGLKAVLDAEFLFS